ncbi:MAG: hypothetical protein AAF960_04545 [Bacteroidota bacterium]
MKHLSREEITQINGGQGGRNLNKSGAITVQDIRDFVSSKAKLLAFLIV